MIKAEGPKGKGKDKAPSKKRKADQDLLVSPVVIPLAPVDLEAEATEMQSLVVKQVCSTLFILGSLASCPCSSLHPDPVPLQVMDEVVRQTEKMGYWIEGQPVCRGMPTPNSDACFAVTDFVLKFGPTCFPNSSCLLNDSITPPLVAAAVC